MKALATKALMLIIFQAGTANATPVDGCPGFTYRCGDQCQSFNAPCGHDTNANSEFHGTYPVEALASTESVNGVTCADCEGLRGMWGYQACIQMYCK